MTCKINGKIYVGKHKTKNLNDSYRGSGKYLRCAIKKYGSENFVREILYVFGSEEEMNAKEREIVTEEFCRRDDTYNICEGGKGGWNYVNKLPEQLNVCRRGGLTTGKLYGKYMGSKWGKWSYENGTGVFSEKAKQRILEANKKRIGAVHTIETKEKIRLKAREKIGVKNSQYGSFWITDGHKNKKTKSEIPNGWKRGRVLNTRRRSLTG